VEYGLLKYLKKKYSGEGSQNRVSLERVVAGSGLPDVYEYLSITFPERVDKTIHDAINKAGDLKAAVIANYKNSNELCRRTMDIFLTHYGSEAGVACLKWIPTGGLYITGGLTPKNIEEIRNQNGLFMQALLDKGRVKAMVAKCPVWAVLVEDLGERGAHVVAFKELQQEIIKAAGATAPSAVGTSSSTESNSGSNSIVKYGIGFVSALLIASFVVGATAQNGPIKLKLPWNS
jgi:glucokinase